MIAHIKQEENKIYIQNLKEHLETTARLCEIYMSRMGCPCMGYLVGILHDLGKIDSCFQKRMESIRDTGIDPGNKTGHASAGAVVLRELAGEPSNMIEKMTVQIMCEAIFSHHASLPDNITPEGEDGYEKRMQLENPEELEAMKQYLYTEIISREKLLNLLEKIYSEMDVIFKSMCRLNADEKELSFFCGQWQKMLLSSLIDADWLDSLLCGREDDYLESLILQEKNYHENRKKIFESLTETFESNLKGNQFEASCLNHWRNHISLQCKNAAGRTGGIYILRCPTGAGKTLASLRYALNHCLQCGKDKIYYILPYLTVIDQSAKSIRQMLDTGKNEEQVEQCILELHSNVESEKPDKEKKEDQSFFAQRMDEPIVLTTLVRFLNTFFAKGTRNLRPAHQFENAVLIFDEIQSLPIKQIALFNSLLNFLAYVCNCTCILCTATQPLLAETEKPVYPIRLMVGADLVTLPGDAYDTFRRVKVEDSTKAGGYKAEEIVSFLLDKMETNQNVLMIMNTKEAARKIYEQVVEKTNPEYRVFYLSTRLYAAHRKQIIRDITKALENEEKIIVISTQLIEAGIDLDFSCVVRSIAGLDSIIQAAGRCNRRGRENLKITYIINPNPEVEKLSSLRDIKEGVRCTYRVLEEYKTNPEQFDYELLSEKAVYRFFQYYFFARQSEMSYLLKNITEYTLYDLLADNRNLRKYAVLHDSYKKKILNQSFRTAAEQFFVIEDRGNSVFVPREEGEQIWKEIQRCEDFKEKRYLLKRAQQYIINISDQELKTSGNGRGRIFWDDKMGMYVLNKMYYNPKTGLTQEVNDDVPLYQY